jgi:hypothetical protein
MLLEKDEYPFHSDLYSSQKSISPLSGNTSSVQHGNHTITFGNANKTDMEHETGHKNISMSDSAKNLVGKHSEGIKTPIASTTRVSVKNNKTGLETHHHVMMSGKNNSNCLLSTLGKHDDEDRFSSSHVDHLSSSHDKNHSTVLKDYLNRGTSLKESRNISSFSNFSNKNTIDKQIKPKEVSNHIETADIKQPAKPNYISKHIEPKVVHPIIKQEVPSIPVTKTNTIKPQGKLKGILK